MERTNKMKIVLLCSFSNPLIRSLLYLKTNRKFFKVLISFFKLPVRVGEYRDYAPWISNLINEFEKREDIELHVITPHLGLNPKMQEFQNNGIYYHFYCSEFSSFMRIVDNLKVWNVFQRNSSIVKKIINQINPDLINVVGIENPENAIPVLYIKDKPIYVLSQTIYSNPDRIKYLKPKRINWDLEVLIHKRLKYFGVYSKMHGNLLLQNNSKAIIFDYNLPKGSMPKVKVLAKKYDFVNFALSLDLRKGAHDSIKALAIVKTKYPDVKLNLVGGCDDRNKQELVCLIEKLGLQENIEFTSFFEKQEDMFQHLQNSRFAVLPCKLDVTSQTMEQAMYYELPLVVYETTGTPEFNFEKECVLISEMGNIKSLAANMLLLLNDPDKADELRLNAKEYMVNAMDNSKVMNRLIDEYKAIINHYHRGIKISEELLFGFKKTVYN